MKEKLLIDTTVREKIFFRESQALTDMYVQDQMYAQLISVKCKLLSKMDRGFFIADDEWTCYRRNYFQVSSSFEVTVNGNPVEAELSVFSEGRRIAVKEFHIAIQAKVFNGDRSIDLIQHTAKRDKGPQLVPEPRLILPGGNQNSFSQNTPKSVVNFERLQFKSATANNGKRRAAQQFFGIEMDLFCVTVDNRSVKVCSTRSGPLIVRGRSPSHYSDGSNQKYLTSDASFDLNSAIFPASRTPSTIYPNSAGPFGEPLSASPFSPLQGNYRSDNAVYCPSSAILSNSFNNSIPLNRFAPTSAPGFTDTGMSNQGYFGNNMSTQHYNLPEQYQSTSNDSNNVNNNSTILNNCNINSSQKYYSNDFKYQPYQPQAQTQNQGNIADRGGNWNWKQENPNWIRSRGESANSYATNDSYSSFEEHPVSQIRRLPFLDPYNSPPSEAERKYHTPQFSSILNPTSTMRQDVNDRNINVYRANNFTGSALGRQNNIQYSNNVIGYVNETEFHNPQ